VKGMLARNRLRRQLIGKLKSTPARSTRIRLSNPSRFPLA